MKITSWLCFASFVIAFGCDKSSDPGSPTAGDFTNQYLGSICAYYVRCGVMADTAGCKTVLGEEALAPIEDAIKAGRIKYHSEKASNCFGMLANISCSSQALNTPSINAACEPTLEGTVAMGGACQNLNECVSRNCKKENCTSACCLGVCAEKKPVATVGSPCRSSTDCANSDFCDNATPANGTCRARIAAGQPCPAGSQCAEGSICVATSPAERTCRLPPKDGESCASLPVCDSLTSFCDAKDRVCKPRKKIGEPCVGANDCLAFATCAGGTCIRKPLPGESCTITDAGAFASSCFTGKCTGGVCIKQTTPVCGRDAGIPSQTPQGMLQLMPAAPF